MLLFLVSLAYADFGEVWIKKYAFVAGLDFAISKGDLDGGTNFLVYAFDARALANAHSIALNLGLGFPDYKYVDIEQSGEPTYFRYGIEYQYHFFWPEPFRIGVGLGFAFSSLMFPSTSLTGNGGHAVLSAQYYITKNFAMESAIRPRFLRLNRIATEEKSNVSRLSEPVWQGVGELGFRGMFVF
ncbi:MAG: hypothetical protein LBC75_06995 [Fibromonadaceae bacterium]|nr:hypothetical protein [Fibromonadaceae bacterium]